MTVPHAGMAASQLAVTGSAALLAAAVLLWRWRRWRKQCWEDFEALPDRSRVHSVKHELPTALFGEAADGALQMWVADINANVQILTGMGMVFGTSTGKKKSSVVSAGVGNIRAMWEKGGK